LWARALVVVLVTASLGWLAQTLPAQFSQPLVALWQVVSSET
jgi:hypothetical protein